MWFVFVDVVCFKMEFRCVVQAGVNSSDPPVSASHLAETTGVHCHAWFLAGVLSYLYSVAFSICPWWDPFLVVSKWTPLLFVYIYTQIQNNNTFLTNFYLSVVASVNHQSTTKGYLLSRYFKMTSSVFGVQHLIS